jgi:inositol-phosphate transport system permease protein
MLTADSDVVKTTSASSQPTRFLWGNVIAAAGALLAIGAFFLPWFDLVAQGKTFLSISGQEALSPTAITSAGGGVLFRGSPLYAIVPLIGVIALLLAALSFWRGYETEWDGFGYIILGLLGIVLPMIRFVGLRRMIRGEKVFIELGFGMQLVLLAMLILMVAGAINTRAVTKRKASLGAIITAWGFMSPAAFLALAFLLIPAVLLFILSLTDLSSANFSDPWNFIGLKNYRSMFSDRFFPKILGNTFHYVGLTLIFNTLIAMGLALLTVSIDRRAGAFYRLLWLLPRITPSVVYIVMWRRLAEESPYGIINQFLSLLGINSTQSLLSASPWTFVILTNGFVGISFGLIIFSSAIEAIPKDLNIAAKVDGASGWQVVRDITLPLLKWPFLFVLTYQTLSLLVSFEYILLLTSGGPKLFQTETWALTAYNRALFSYFGSNQWGLGAAWGFLLVVIGGVLAVVYLRVFRFDDLVQEPKIDVL